MQVRLGEIANSSISGLADGAVMRIANESCPIGSSDQRGFTLVEVIVVLS
ncbi:MAG: prepilin-type N-terminal cleavage/methylation domain-containing protein, partial [Planctomycetes bacterium]|nr:prepilin-type N-terminal cleavage/methylation domain-containing protein [Planctomycetota bacterium]